MKPKHNIVVTNKQYISSQALQTQYTLHGMPPQRQRTLLLAHRIELGLRTACSLTVEFLVAHVECKCDGAYSGDQSGVESNGRAETVDVARSILLLAMGELVRKCMGD